MDFRRFDLMLAGSRRLPNCAVCLDPLTRSLEFKNGTVCIPAQDLVLKLGCHHVFHWHCMQGYHRRECPTCRVPFGSRAFDLEDFRKDYLVALR